MTWTIQLLRIAVMAPLLYLLYRSQRYWIGRILKWISRVREPAARRALQIAAAVILFAWIFPGLTWVVTGTRQPLPAVFSFPVSGLWLSSALFGWLGICAVAGVEKLWNRLRARKETPAKPVAPADPSRRYFFQTAGYVAGAVPFVGAFYGFLFERLHFRVESVEIPIPGLPEALDGFRIAQLSDIHSGGYMPAGQIRRAVEMANDLDAQLAVVTGDFITGRNDPLEACVEELARLRAPLGVWGCNGNHEIYAGVEDQTGGLFAQAGMKLLRQACAEIRWRGQALNLLGVDYQAQRGLWAARRRGPMLSEVESLVRRDVPNILLSHNPNAFVRAADLGIELTLAGHTHGGQVQVEILHERFNPARFMTEFTAGLYSRAMAAAGAPRQAHLYVNRGIGTIGMPVRFGAPPEITLITLRRA